MKHPCQFSQEVLDVIEPLLRKGEHVHDPFAGPGNRLAALCDKIGCTFTGGDIEDWPGKDERVIVGDALASWSYPETMDVVVTSPVYVNKRCGDYANGPTPTTKVRGRRDYGISLGRALSENNLARYTGRPRKADEYWRLHAETVNLWPDRVIVNVDSPILSGWLDLLEGAGYGDFSIENAHTRRYGGLSNAEKRAEYEVVIVAER